MPRKVIGEKVEKVISSTISTENFHALQKYTKDLYIQGRIAQPTISHLVRAIINGWIRKRMIKEGKAFSPFQGSARFPPDDLL